MLIQIIVNPEYGDYYTKNWMVFNGCTRVFSKSKGIEVAFLHSKQCLEKVSSCSDLYKGYEEPTFDGEYWHLPLNDYFLNGNIKWKK